MDFQPALFAGGDFGVQLTLALQFGFQSSAIR
jgi:hypothetical protein